MTIDEVVVSAAARVLENCPPLFDGEDFENAAFDMSKAAYATGRFPVHPDQRAAIEAEVREKVAQELMTYRERFAEDGPHHLRYGLGEAVRFVRESIKTLDVS